MTLILVGLFDNNSARFDLSAQVTTILSLSSTLISLVLNFVDHYSFKSLIKLQTFVVLLFVAQRKDAKSINNCDFEMTLINYTSRNGRLTKIKAACALAIQQKQQAFINDVQYAKICEAVKQCYQLKENENVMYLNLIVVFLVAFLVVNMNFPFVQCTILDLL